jgi:hypothetical protein
MTGGAAPQGDAQGLRVVAGFLTAPPVVGFVTALTVSAPMTMDMFRLVGIVATVVAAFATLFLGVPTFRRLEEERRTRWRIYLRKGAVLGVIVSAPVNVPLLFMLLVPHIFTGPIDEIPNDVAVISSLAAYCAFLGIVGAAVFWLIVRPDRQTS